MPFVGRTVGGSWLGGGTFVPNCNVTNQSAITTGFNILTTLGIPCAVNLGNLDQLVNCLRGKTVGSVSIDCCDPSCGTGCNQNFGTAPRGGNSITLCSPALPPNTQADCDVTVFHELIHSCGGTEIDSWSLENHCYAGHGTFDPSGQDFLSQTTDVGGGLRAGTFVVVERTTGRVFVKRQTGGSWLSPPTITRGAELNVNRASYMF